MGGIPCMEAMGYTYSWYVLDGSKEALSKSGVTDFVLTTETSGDFIEVSFTEIAVAFGVSVDKLRIKF